jgi:hypothetical protein
MRAGVARPVTSASGPKARSSNPNATAAGTAANTHPRLAGCWLHFDFGERQLVLVIAGALQFAIGMHDLGRATGIAARAVGVMKLDKFLEGTFDFGPVGTRLKAERGISGRVGRHP